MKKKWLLFILLVFILVAGTVALVAVATHKPMKKLPDGLVVVSFPSAPQEQGSTGAQTTDGGTSVPINPDQSAPSGEAPTEGSDEGVPTCGNTVCETGENSETCLADCPVIPSGDVPPADGSTGTSGGSTTENSNTQSDGSEDNSQGRTSQSPQQTESTDKAPDTTEFASLCIAKGQCALVKVSGAGADTNLAQNLEPCSSNKDCEDFQASPSEEVPQYNPPAGASLLLEMLKRVLGITA